MKLSAASGQANVLDPGSLGRGIMNKIILLSVSFLLLNTSTTFCDDSVCTHFYNNLSELPHNRLVENISGITSIWDGENLQGCEIVYESDISLVPGTDVYKLFESLIYCPNWIIHNNFISGGPGSSTVGIENKMNRCLLNWSQHAWLDEETNEQKQSNQIKIIVQCSDK